MRQTKQQLQRFEGTYRDMRTPGWHFNVTAQEGGLQIQDIFGSYKLLQKKDLLFEDEKGQIAAFKADNTGKITYLSFHKPDSWAEKLPDPKIYVDVEKNHPYAKYIYYVQQQGLVSGTDHKFNPDGPISRGEFIAQLMKLIGFKLSNEPVQFIDSLKSPYASAIQSAFEFGIVQDTPDKAFKPDQPITRQEAAVFVWRMLQIGLGAQPLDAKLKGNTDSWALDAVRYVVAKGNYGPEIVPDKGGAVDYQSKRTMLRKEAAALLYYFP